MERVNYTSLLSKAENIETLFKKDINFKKASRKRLNVSNKIVSQKDIDILESEGLTSELLQSLDLPYFEYKTQITVHGDFSKLNNHYSFGYKNIIPNKNNSLQVKYSAIDLGKRVELASMLKYVNISFCKNSQESYFHKSYVFNEATNNEIMKLVEVAESIKDLYNGSVYVYKINFLGLWYISFKMYLHTIPSENVIKIAKAFGYTDELKAKIELENEIKIKQINDEYKKQNENDEVIRKAEIKKAIELGFENECMVQPNNNDIILLISVYKGEPSYTLRFFDNPKNSRSKLRYASKYYKSLADVKEAITNIDKFLIYSQPIVKNGKFLALKLNK